MRGVAILVCGMVAVRSAAAERATSVYVEAFGKGGLWGLGADHRVASRIVVGGVVSGHSLEGERYLSLSPYVSYYLLKRGRSAWFADAGVQLAHVWSDAHVPEWAGDSSTGIGAIVSSGYEFRGQLLVRAYVHGVAGRGGVFPWFGIAAGWTF
ncbi:MAG: hypothetical protein KIT31_35865 [Deltaproteobacteria bacterium]|nr:hypothetical protein [Deltaproteobacteria bacterium]